MIQGVQESPEESYKMLKEIGEEFMKAVRGSQYDWVKPKEGKKGKMRSLNHLKVRIAR